jgi:hypothetical protein
MPPKSPRALWDKLSKAIRKDPQKAGILTVLVAILLVLQFRLQTSRSEGPSQALAAPTGPTAGTPSHNQWSPSDGTGQSAAPVDSATALRLWMNATPAPITRNLFAVDLDRYPQDGHRVATAPRGGQGFWDDLAKSMSFRADVKKERQTLVENLQQRASQLRLQSTLMGASPKAVIDGDLVGEGDVVASFRVLKIEPRRIIVEREGIKLEILMK